MRLGQNYKGGLEDNKNYKFGKKAEVYLGPFHIYLYSIITCFKTGRIGTLFHRLLNSGLQHSMIGMYVPIGIRL